MASFAVFGTSVNGGAVTVTIPAGSNHAALMVWAYEDISGGGTPTLPAGSTGTLIASPPFFRAGRAYVITGLSAGSATFTPPATGGSQWCTVLVADDVEQITPTGTPVSGGVVDLWSAIDDFANVDISTPGTNDLAVLVVGHPTTPPGGSSSGGATFHGQSGTADYGGAGSLFSKARTGATTNIDSGAGIGNQAFAVALLGAAVSTTTTTTTAAPTTTTTTTTAAPTTTTTTTTAAPIPSSNAVLVSQAVGPNQAQLGTGFASDAVIS